MVYTVSYPAMYVGETEIFYYVPGYFACDWNHEAVKKTATVSTDERTALLAAIDHLRKIGRAK